MQNLPGIRTKHRTKQNIYRPYRWDSYMDPLPGEDPTKWTEADLKPFFLYPGHYQIEDWTLEMIRRKYFDVLADAKDYERDRWMPKALMMMSFIMKNEIVSLREVSMWFGMPRDYLKELCERDPSFRRLVIHWRRQKLDTKASRTRSSVMGLRENWLMRIKPHWTATIMNDRETMPYKYNIDVGWKPRIFSRKR